MMRIEVKKSDFEKNLWNNNVVVQERICRRYNAHIIRNGVEEKVFIVGVYTLTGETPDFYELSEFNWVTLNNLGGEWNKDYDINSFINGEYSLQGYVDDGIISDIKWESNHEVYHEYFLTNLPPACEISLNNRPNMEVEREFDGTDVEINERILSLLNWRNYFVPDPNGLGTENKYALIGEILSQNI